MHYCMVCLNCDVKLFGIKDNSIGDIYSTLTQIQVANWNQHVCFECAALLQKYQQFKLRCIRADKILSETVIMPEVGKSHLQTLQNHFKLASNLGFSETITEDVVETINEIKTENLNDDEMFILLPNDEGISPPCVELKMEKEHDESEDEESCNNRLLSISVSQEGKIVCGQKTNNPNATDVINTTNTPSAKNKSNKQETFVPKAEIPSVSSDDESYHSDSSWTTILNTLKRIRNTNKELTSNKKANVCSAESKLKFNKVLPKIKSNEIKKANVCSAESKLKLNKVLPKNKSNEIKKKSLKTTKINVEKINVKKINANKSDVNKINVTQTKVRLKPGPKKKETKSEKQDKERYRNICRKQKLLKQYGTLVCMTQEQLKSELLAREHSDNYCNSTFKCNLCFRGFKHENTYENHMIRHNPVRGKYECDNCHFRFLTRKLMKYHLQSAHTIKFTCGDPQCSFVCCNLAIALAHVVNLHKKQGENYECKFCGAKFRVSNTLSGHLYKWHRNEFKDEYVCEFCGRTFYNKQGLSVHKSNHYNEQNDHKGPECKECNVHFATEQAWKLHLVLSRNHEVANGCKTCGKTFDKDEDLTSHKKLHKRVEESRKPKSLNLKVKSEIYACTFCDFQSKNSYFYKLHLHKMHRQPTPEKRVHDRPYVCEICGDKFSFQLLLKTHIMKHTGERPYKCQYCGQGFRYKVALTAHENVHTRAEIFQCNYCEKEFLRKTSLFKHTRIHLGDTPQKCSKCRQSFTSLSILKAHIRHKHEKVPYPPRKNPRYKRPKDLEPDAEENLMPRLEARLSIRRTTRPIALHD